MKKLAPLCQRIIPFTIIFCVLLQIDLYSAENFIGTQDLLFSNPANWESGILPAAGEDIEIKSDCIFDLAGTPKYGKLKIYSSYTLGFGLAGEVLQIEKLESGNGATLDMTNGGTLKLDEWYASANYLTFIPGAGTVQFTDNNDFKEGFTQYNNLIIDVGTGHSIKLKDNIIITGDLTINSGTLKAYNHDIIIEGDWNNSGGYFEEDEQLVTFSGCGQTFSSHTVPDQFYDLTISSCTCVAFLTEVEILGTFTSESTGLCDQINSAGQSNFTGPDWSTKGNIIDNQDNFLGTINDQDLNIRTNNLDRIIISKTGEIKVNNIPQGNSLDKVLVEDANGILHYRDLSTMGDNDNDPTNELQTWNTLPDIPADFSDGTDNVIDADSDPTNELQDWTTLPGIPAEIADGDHVDDADSDPANELQILSLTGNDLSISGRNTITLPDNVDDADADPNNELNTSLALNGSTLELTDAGGTITADLSTLPDAVDDADSDPTNELQDWSTLPGIPAEIADGDQVDDADNDPTNELDHDWYKVGTTNQSTDITDNVFTQGNVSIGLNNPQARLHVKGTSNSPFDLTGLFEQQNGERIFWMKNSGEVYVGEDRNATSGGKFLVVTDEPNERGIVIQNKDDVSTSAASILSLYRGTGNAVALGSYGDVDRAEIRTTETFRTKAQRVQFQVSINPAHDDRKLVDIYTTTGGDLVMDAKSNPPPGNFANAVFNLIGSQGFLSNKGTDQDGESRFTNKQENNEFVIQTFGSSYSFLPALANKSLIQATNHDLYIVSGFGNNLHLGRHIGAGQFESTLFVDNSNDRIGVGTVSPTEKLHVAGNVFADGGIFITSDSRFKKEIKSLDNILQKINHLKGVSYFFRTDEFKDRNFSVEKQIGLIAQNLEEVFPELVKTYADGYKAVNYDGLIPVLLEGIKAQTQMIDEVQSKNELLNEKLNLLEKENEEIKTRLEEIDNKLSLLFQFDELKDQSKTYREIELNNEKHIWLNQNIPNPFEENTSIAYYIPDGVLDAELVINDNTGKVLKKIKLEPGEGVIKVFAANLSSGIYSYSILVKGKIIETKQMIMTK